MKSHRMKRNFCKLSQKLPSVAAVDSEVVRVPEKEKGSSVAGIKLIIWQLSPLYINQEGPPESLFPRYVKAELLHCVTSGMYLFFPSHMTVHGKNCFTIPQNILSCNIDSITEIGSSGKGITNMLQMYFSEICGKQWGDKYHEILKALNVMYEINKYFPEVKCVQLRDQSPAAAAKLLTGYYFSRVPAGYRSNGIVLY